MVNNTRYRGGVLKALTLAVIARGATSQTEAIKLICAPPLNLHTPEVVRALLWRLRKQGCITVTGQLEHREYIYAIAPPGEAYLIKERRRAARRVTSI